MYAIPAILIALVAAHNTYVLQKNRVARGSKTVSLSETMSRLTTLMMASLFLACLDIEMYNNTYHVLVHNCLVVSISRGGGGGAGGGGLSTDGIRKTRH